MPKTTSYKYTVKIEAAKGGGYTFSVPAFPGLISETTTFAGVELVAHKGIALYLQFLDEMGKPRPKDVRPPVAKGPQFITIKGTVPKHKKRKDFERRELSNPAARVVRTGLLNASTKPTKQAVLEEDYFLREGQALSHTYQHAESIDELRATLKELADDFWEIGTHYKLVKRQARKKRKK